MVPTEGAGHSVACEPPGDGARSPISASRGPGSRRSPAPGPRANRGRGRGARALHWHQAAARGCRRRRPGGAMDWTTGQETGAREPATALAAAAADRQPPSAANGASGISKLTSIQMAKLLRPGRCARNSGVRREAEAKCDARQYQQRDGRGRHWLADLVLLSGERGTGHGSGHGSVW